MWKANPAMGFRAFKLAIRGFLAQRQTSAAIMSLSPSARLNGHVPYAYLKGVLTRLSMPRPSEIIE